MKRYMMVLVFLCVCCVLGGCNAKKDPFTVYVPTENRMMKEVVAEYQKNHPELEMHIEEFAERGDLETRLSTELMSGKGPDVILMTDNMDLDAWKMVENQSFLELNIQEIDETQYLNGVLESGRYQNQQYFLPLSFTVPQFYTSEEKLEERKLNIEEEVSVRELMELLREDMQNDNDAEYGCLVNQLSDGASIYRWMQNAGYSMLDGEIDETLLHEIADTWKLAIARQDKIKELTSRYANNFIGIIEHVTFMLEDVQLTNNIRYYATLYNTQAGVTMRMVTPIAEDGYRVRINAWGGLKKSTQHANEGMELLRSMMDYPVHSDFFKYKEERYDLSVNRSVLEENLQEVMSKTGRAKPMSQELGEPYATQVGELIEQIQSAYIPNSAVEKIVNEALRPYLEGTSDYESCYEEMAGRLSRYVSE